MNFCGLKIVTKEDLRPLRHLRGLYLQNNELEFLGNDLFEFNPDIEEINLCDNKLKNVAIGVFEPLKNLQKVEILRNLCIDASAIRSTEVEILIRNVKEKCPPKIITHLPEIDSTGSDDNNFKFKINEMARKIKNLEKSLMKVCEMCRDSEL